MKTVVISYSFTGNNDSLATSIADKLGADHKRVIEEKERTFFSITMDMLFGKCPKNALSPEIIRDYDMVVLIGPIWMGCVASPLRTYLKEIKKTKGKYAFVSISGGALNDNPKIYDELVKKTGLKPAKVIDMHIKDLLPEEPAPTREMTSEYKVTEEDVIKLTDEAVRELAALA